MQFCLVDGFEQIVDAVELEGLHGIVVEGGGEDDGDGGRRCAQGLKTQSRVLSKDLTIY